jgi:hypothetical protein
MRLNSGILSVFLLSLGLIVCASCADKKPVSYFLISPPVGAEGVPEADRDQLCTVLDAFAVKHKMAKFKAGQPGIIRYYQPNSDYKIGFYAKREPGSLKVFALPMTPGVAYEDYYVTFRQDLANVLVAAFPGRIRMATGK